MQLLCVFGAVIVVSIIIRGDVSREGVDLALEVVERGDGGWVGVCEHARGRARVDAPETGRAR